MPGDRFNVYLHGAPGSSRELDLFGDHRAGFDYAPDRFSADAQFDLDALSSDIERRSAGRPIGLTGFSMGGYIALELAHRLGARVAAIDLIAAAAPLSGGDCLDLMAGKPLFAAARDNTDYFDFIVTLQSVLTRYFRSFVRSMLFANCKGGDIAIARNRHFKRTITAILQATMKGKAEPYRHEIKAYVGDWAAILPTIGAPVTLWQGTLDNWVPPAMADYLRNTLPNVVAFHAIEGASHYSTLAYVLSRIPEPSP